jgi:phage shock protein C
MIGGVCAAFALQYGWDISLVRVVTAAIAILSSGFGGLAYLAAWIIIPEAPYQLPMGTPGNPIV